MREIRLSGSEGGGAARSPYPYPGAKEKAYYGLEAIMSHHVPLKG